MFEIRASRPTRRAARLAVLAAVLAAGTAFAGTATYHVVPGDGTEVVFESKAPLESFEGRTAGVSGWCRFDPDDLAAGVELEIAVDLASFDTGLGKRNQHMRENHLETDRFPQAFFRGGTVNPTGASAALAAGETSTVVLNGSLDLHGVKREAAVEVSLSRDAADGLAVAAEFIVKLSDHEIERPKFLVMKLADEQKVRVRLSLEKEAN
jgi:polyisoprenoid-binding protein YceI